MTHAPPYRHAIRDGLFARERPAVRARGTIVWIHGLGESGLCFEAIAARPEFSSFHTLIPDLPGYGRTAWPDEPTGLEALSRDLAGWIVRRDPTPPVILAGHSMGGVLALLVAEGRPEAAHAVLDIDGNVSEGDCTFSAAAAEVEERLFVEQLFDELREQVHRAGLDEPALRGYHASLHFADPRSFHRHSVDLLRLSREESLAGRLAGLGRPVLYVAGVPGGACVRTRRLLRSAGVPLAEIRPSGHWPFLDLPERFAEVAGRFISRLAGA